MRLPKMALSGVVSNNPGPVVFAVRLVKVFLTCTMGNLSYKRTL